MNNSLRSLFIEVVSGRNSSFLAENALETHCFALGGNEFRLRDMSLRREKMMFIIYNTLMYRTVF